MDLEIGKVEHQILALKSFKNFLGLELILNEGKIIDTSFTIAPLQRNTREENENKKGEGDGLWNDKPYKKLL